MAAFSWLSEPGVRELIDRLPLPIVLAREDGTVVFANRLFTERFGRVRLSPRDLATDGPSVEGEWRPVRLAPGDRDEAPAKASAVRLRDGVMLVAGDVHGNGFPRELDALRSRIAELERLSSTDRLTGVWNRTHLDRIIEFELARTIRFRQPLSLILVDVDHFKEVNDTLGHQVGDAVLRELVAVLKRNIRPSDALFRWGGDEFLMLSTSSGYRAAEALGERLRGAVQRHRFSGAPPRTVSIGVAEYLAPESADVWFARADGALYAAKNEGRNRVYVDRRGCSDQWLAESGVSALQLIWREAYECGEPLIDVAHRELFELGNAVIASAIAVEGDSIALNGALDALLLHVERHFADEEALLERAGYPRLEAHRRAHERLLARARELRAAAHVGTAGLDKLVDYLANDVVARHLFTMDRDYFPLFAADAGDRRQGEAVA